MKLKFTLLVLVMAYFCRDGARGQSQTKVAPDCAIGGAFTVPGSSSAFDNRTASGASGVPCRYWTISYSSTGFSALSLVVEDAPDASGVPGMFVTFTGTVVDGVNPNTNTAEATTDFNGYFPWMRVTLSSKTGVGSVGYQLNGWRTNQATIASGSSSSGCPGTLATPCLTAGVDSTGAAIIPFQIGTLAPVIFDTSSSGNTLLVAASGTTKVRILKFSVIDVAGGNTIQLKQGIGATCGTGTTNLGMVYTGVLSVAQDYNSDNAPLIGLAGNAVCINLTNATRVVGEVQYAQY